MYEPINRANPLWSGKSLYQQDANFYRIGKHGDSFFYG
jgi:hypothetical protein